MPRLLLLSVLSFLSLASCKKGQPALTDEDKAGEHFTAGSKVKAPLGKRKKSSATVLELYGKLAKLKFAYDIGWAHLKDLEPQGAIELYPEGDTCSAAVGDKVRAHWSTARTLTGATVDEVYGKMVHLQFDDNDVDWALCDDLQPPAEASEESGGGGGVSDEVRKCRNGCNRSCHGAKNKSKCVNECRRACEG